MRELVRVAVPGGRVALTIWPERLIAVNQLWDDVMTAAGVEPPPRQALPPGLDFQRTASGLEALVVKAGLVQVAVREADVVLRISPDDLWRAADGGIATIGAVYRVLPGTALLAVGSTR